MYRDLITQVPGLPKNTFGLSVMAAIIWLPRFGSFLFLGEMLSLSSRKDQLIWTTPSSTFDAVT